MYVKGGNAYQNGKFVENKGICIKEKYFVPWEENGASQEQILDAEDGFIIPGLIDIHFHGCAGYDFCDATRESLHAMAVYELQHGVTAIHPASMTLPEKTLKKVYENAADFYKEQQQNEQCLQKESEFVGIYMEGPFICMEKKGAQNPAYVKEPDYEMYQRLQQAAEHLIHVCIVAPEMEGAQSFIEKVSKEVTVSIGHTNADYAVAAAGFKNGASEVTHLYNAMPPFSHRAPGVVGAACDDEKTRVEMICDGVHLHPSAIRTSFRMFGSDRIILISDSMSAAGMEDGAYQLGGQGVTVKGRFATLTENGTLAGSVTNLFDCMRYAVQEANIPLKQVVQCVTENPAKAVGIWDKFGSIESGKYADFIVMDKNMEIRYIVKHGKVVRTCHEPTEQGLQDKEKLAYGES